MTHGAPRGARLRTQLSKPNDMAAPPLSDAGALDAIGGYQLNRRQFVRMASFALGAGALSLTAACGGSSGNSKTGAGNSDTASLAKLNEMSGSERQSFLEAQAAKEGKVVMYSADDPVLLQKWQSAFNKQYPKVQAQFVRLSVPQVLQKAISEQQTGKPAAGLLHVDGQSLAVLEQSKYIQSYKSPEAANFDKQYVDPGGLWVVEWVDRYVTAYNTQHINQSDVPTTIEGLASPKLKGKIGMPSVGGPEFVASLLKKKGKDKTTEILEKLSKQDVKLYPSNTALGNALTAGQVAIGFAFLLEIAAKLTDQGAPVKWLVPDVVLVEPYFQVMAKNPPHPFAAALAYDWIISKQGQQFVGSDRILGPRNDVDYPGAQVTARQQGEKIGANVIEAADMFMGKNDYEDLYKKYFAS